MEDTIIPTLSQEASPKETLGRRQLLKAIAATGGAVAASSLLPGEWAKPVVEVGVLPAHAQVSEGQATFRLSCDSLPGGGDISGVFNYTITQIQPLLEVASGSSSVEGFSATMTAVAAPGTTLLPTFLPSLPQTTDTVSSGRAHFPDLHVSANSTTHFLLVFTVDTPVGPIVVQCGVFDAPAD